MTDLKGTDTLTTLQGCISAPVKVMFRQAQHDKSGLDAEPGIVNRQAVGTIGEKTIFRQYKGFSGKCPWK